MNGLVAPKLEQCSRCGFQWRSVCASDKDCPLCKCNEAWDAYRKRTDEANAAREHGFDLERELGKATDRIRELESEVAHLRECADMLGRQASRLGAQRDEPEDLDDVE